ncbi:MAG: hypothetical protein KNN13_03875 [Hydrogenobacter thermophilus]|uniref:hypothetical protein n=1 Tax=Hydrogenobacter thermophilus TaxID=940 RepID=UPI001C750292|nr:hypothetical protein [Hydrogenobacter thermophilus]QWK20467.1 MAG: hypothetical protein KNN13_03875 [Hydrogenobacter thermophilus]
MIRVGKVVEVDDKNRKSQSADRRRRCSHNLLAPSSPSKDTDTTNTTGYQI